MGYKCFKCGLPIAFKIVAGKSCPVNVDGSDHWDLCKATTSASLPASARTQYFGFVGARDFRLPPWDGIESPFLDDDDLCASLADGKGLRATENRLGVEAASLDYGTIKGGLVVGATSSVNSRADQDTRERT
jgi:hypothetical protein